MNTSADPPSPASIHPPPLWLRSAKMSSKSRRCYDCEDRFVDSFAAYQHCRDVGHSQAWECDECELYFAWEEDLDDHYDKRHEEYECVHCDDRIFCGQDALNQHQTAKHVIQCNDCNRTFATSEALSAHTSTYHNLTCARCGGFYQHKNQLNKHLTSPNHTEAIRRHLAQILQCCARPA
jgi:hypothetical protein